MIKLKAPRIYHLPWSEVVSKDDKFIRNKSMFRDKNVVITLKADGECLLSSTKISMSDETYSCIGDLVKNKRVGEYVLGVDDNNSIIPSKITNVFYNGNTEEWLSVNVKGNKSKYQSIKCTKNHKFYTDFGYIEAEKLTSEDSVYLQESYIELTDLQKQVLLGKLLGDGSLHYAASNTNIDKASIQFGHKKDHKEYLDYTNYLLGTISRGVNSYKSGFGTCMLKSYTANTWDIYRTFSCLKDSKNKEIPKEILKLSSPITLALWYMDDGSLQSNCSQRDRVMLSTCAFNEDSCNNLIEMLNGFNIVAKLVNYKSYNYISINADNTEKFFELISEYVVDCMQYKLSPKFRGRFKKLDQDIIEPKKLIRLRKVKIYSITPYLHNVLRGKYDIETETHNYFANGVLVHNCISLYNDGSFHARSLHSKQHESRDWLHSWWADKLYSNSYTTNINSKWPELRLVGENMYATHTIKYNNLEGLFLLHSAWNNNTCLSWQDTLYIADKLNINTVPLLYEGLYDEDIIRNYNKLEVYNNDLVEGYVVRNSNEYMYMDSDNNIGKFVSNRFNNTVKSNWYFNSIERNRTISCS